MTTVAPMVPIQETVLAIDNLDPPDEFDLIPGLRSLADRAQAVVPDLVGVSVARLAQGLTFTLVAITEEIAVLDAVQYLAGGPCVEAARINHVVTFDNTDALDEDRWHLFAQATSAHAIRTTLTLPIREGEHVVGTVNLYAGSPQAFVGHHDELAEIFGAWSAGAVANADLDFTTRGEAEGAPAQIYEQLAIDTAIGVTAAQYGLGLEVGVAVEVAEALMREAALRAGVSLHHLAQEVLTNRNVQTDKRRD